MNVSYSVTKRTRLFQKGKNIPWSLSQLITPDKKRYVSLTAPGGELIVLKECDTGDYEKLIDILVSALELDNIEAEEGEQCGQSASM